MRSHYFLDTVLLYNQIVHSKAANDLLLEINNPVEINMLCGYLEIIRLAGGIRHVGIYE